jgi:hypothetical protein
MEVAERLDLLPDDFLYDLLLDFLFRFCFAGFIQIVLPLPLPLDLLREVPIDLESLLLTDL